MNLLVHSRVAAVAPARNAWISRAGPVEPIFLLLSLFYNIPPFSPFNLLFPKLFLFKIKYYIRSFILEPRNGSWTEFLTFTGLSSSCFRCSRTFFYFLPLIHLIRSPFLWKLNTGSNVVYESRWRSSKGIYELYGCLLYLLFFPNSLDWLLSNLHKSVFINHCCVLCIMFKISVLFITFSWMRDIPWLHNISCSFIDYTPIPLDSPLTLAFFQFLVTFIY